MSRLPQALSEPDLASLIRAYHHLESPSFAARLSAVVGTPVEMAMELLPLSWKRRIQHCSEAGIRRALDFAISKHREHDPAPPRCRRYKWLGTATGAVGGFFGGPCLLLELPITTTIMLSSIAEIARSEGENLGTLEARLACVEVFAFGGRSNPDDFADSGYYGLRLALEAPVAGAAAFLGAQGLPSRGQPPVLVNLISTVAERFGVAMSEKAMAKLVPVIGAASGAFVNHIFIQHFQDMARSHFTIRRLERKYSPGLVRSQYERIAACRLPGLPAQSRKRLQQLPAQSLQWAG